MLGMPGQNRRAVNDRRVVAERRGGTERRVFLRRCERIPIDEEAFRAMHAKDAMAHDKLAEGIEGFSKAIVATEVLLRERYQALQDHGEAGQLARDFFRCFDMDGDGRITREEWAGNTEVFDALDVDGDGAISPEEMAAGLGGGFALR